ncbi:hypothetical protein PoB_000896900 [Plakobranchus ocellatus]|uniref:Uncharacterized protein n=1 Tax=Plakobranchus ocellatus TaxID=259542 RepID=A0AAV3YKA6_9GAST|nr:hypothetical protein PoB_000896900 [Plakobranchus ocellatus]
MRASKTIPVKEKIKKVKGMHHDLPIREEGKIGVKNEDVLNDLLGHDNSDSEFGEEEECLGGEEDFFLTAAHMEYGADKEVSDPLPDTLAGFITQCFRQMMVEDKMKEKFDVFKRPENYPSLAVHLTSKGIWNMIKRDNRKLDRKLSAIQRLI